MLPNSPSPWYGMLARRSWGRRTVHVPNCSTCCSSEAYPLHSPTVPLIPLVPYFKHPSGESVQKTQHRIKTGFFGMSYSPQSPQPAKWKTQRFCNLFVLKLWGEKHSLIPSFLLLFSPQLTLFDLPPPISLFCLPLSCCLSFPLSFLSPPSLRLHLSQSILFNCSNSAPPWCIQLHIL